MAGTLTGFAAAALLFLAPLARGQDAGPAPAADTGGPSSGTCTFDVRDLPIDRALIYVRNAAGGVNIEVSPEAMNEKVTLALSGAEWRDALESIARRSGCTVEEVGPRHLLVAKPPPVDIHIKQAEISQVINLISSLSGANIVSDPEDVKGMVTVHLTGVPWRRALNVIVGSKGFLVVEEPGGILRVVSPGKLRLEVETRIFQLRYLRPPPIFKPKLADTVYVEASGAAAGGGDVEKSFNIIVSLREALKPEGTLNYIAASNSLVLTGTKVKLAQAERMLQQLDVEPLQIFVDMQFVSTSNEDFFNVGAGPDSNGILGSMGLASVTGAIALPFKVGPGGFESAVIPVPDLPLRSSLTPSFSYGNLDFSKTAYFLRLLRNDTRSRIVQAPKLFVLDNQEATIFVGDTVRFAESRAEAAQNGGLKFSIAEAAGSPVSVGFQLMLVPHVIPGTNRVMMTIIPNQKDLVGSSTTQPGFDEFTIGSGVDAQSIFLPRTRSSTLVTTLMVEHGVTAVLGGLMKDTEGKTVHKVPFLGDLPLLGWLFKTEEKSKTKDQLMIFLTPWLVRDVAKQREAIEKELLRREPTMDREWERLTGPAMGEAPATEHVPAKAEPEKKPSGPK